MTHIEAVGIGTQAAATPTVDWFRSIKAFADLLDALGFPKTADSGQVNWATATLPGSNTYTHYEVRRFNDAHQSTKPVFLKIMYGRFSQSSVNYPQVQITIGAATDGAGEIVGPSHTVTFMLASSPDRTDWYGSTDGSGFALLLGGSVANSSWARFFLVIERLRGADGQPLGSHVLITKNSSGGSVTNNDDTVSTAAFDMARGKTSEGPGVPVAYTATIPTAAATLASDNHFLYPFGVLSVLTQDGRAYSKLVVGYAYGDFLNGTLLPIRRFSSETATTYKVLKPTAGPYGFGPMDAGSNFTSTNPSLYAAPALYWE